MTLQTEAKWKIWGWAGAIAVAVGAVYWNSRNAPFIFDDFPAVVRNPSIRDLSRLGAVLDPPLDGAGVTGRPLVNLSYAIDYAVHGLSSPGYHLGSILLHVLASLTLFGVLRRTFLLPGMGGKWNGRATALAGGAALLWAVHPLLTESIVCVAQRNEVLAGLCYLLTFYGFVRSAGTDQPSARWWLVGSVVACWLGVASKELMATAPLLIFLYDRTFVAGTWAEAWRKRKYYHLALAGSWLLLAWLMGKTNQRAGIVGFGLGMSSWDYLVTQSGAIMLYLKLSVWPHPLVVDYGPVIHRLDEVWPAALAVVTLGFATLWAMWRRPKAGFLGAWFFVILAPSSSFVPLTTQTIAEHRMYLPLIPIVLGVVWALDAFARRRQVWLVGALVVVLAAVTVRRNADYLDELQFWKGTIAQEPANARVWASLGYYYLRHQQWNEAIPAYEKAISLRDNFADAHSDLGSILLEVGRIDEGVGQARLAASLKPDDPAIRFNLGAALARAGDHAGAVREWEEALRLRPGLGAAHLRLGEEALTAGRPADAADHFAEAVKVAPADVEALSGWGQALTQQNRLPEAAERFESALKLQPDLAELHYNLGNVRLQMNRLPEAETAYAEALRLKPEMVAARHNLALVLVRQGRLADAIAQYRRVLEQMPDSAVAHENFALALAQAGKIDEAIAEDETALRLDPTLTEVRQHLARLRRR